MDVIEKVKEVMAKRTDVSNLSLDDSLASLGLDSLDLVEVVMDIEEATGVTFEMDDIINFKTIRDVINAINAKL